MNWWKTFLGYELVTFLGHDNEPVDIPLGELICDDLRTFPGAWTSEIVEKIWPHLKG